MGAKPPYFLDSLETATEYRKLPDIEMDEDPRFEKDERHWRDLVRERIGLPHMWKPVGLVAILRRMWVQDGEEGEPQECFNNTQDADIGWNDALSVVEASSNPIFAYAIDFLKPDAGDYYDWEYAFPE